MPAAPSCVGFDISPLLGQTNSLLDSRPNQPLADPEEFGLKIRACKDAQTDPDFNIVARVEAFIAGWGVDEAISRATVYADAGADAVLIHSKKVRVHVERTRPRRLLTRARLCRLTHRTLRRLWSAGMAVRPL